MSCTKSQSIVTLRAANAGARSRLTMRSFALGCLAAACLVTACGRRESSPPASEEPASEEPASEAFVDDPAIIAALEQLGATALTVPTPASATCGRYIASVGEFIAELSEAAAALGARAPEMPPADLRALATRVTNRLERLSEPPPQDDDLVWLHRELIAAARDLAEALADYELAGPETPTPSADAQRVPNATSNLLATVRRIQIACVD